MMQYKHLSLEERIVIQNLIQANKSQNEISKIIKRNKATISREIKRNFEKFKPYCAHKAQYNYLKSRNKENQRKLKKNVNLYCYTIDKIAQYWSPEQISGRIKLDFPKDNSMRISHETIYKFIFKEKEEGNFILAQFLRHKNKKYDKRGRSKKRNSILDKKSIHDRPKIVEKRKRKGDWEGDLIEGKNKTGYIATFVDRKHRILIATKISNKSAETTYDAIIQAFEEQNIKKEDVKTITFDNGTEFAKFNSLEDYFECDIYFADPSSPWQRGTNENTNKLLRQFFPKSLKFSKLDQKMLDQAIKFLRPYESFYNLKPNKKVALHT